MSAAGELEVIQQQNECWNSDDENRCSEYIISTKFPDEITLRSLRTSLRKRKIPKFLELNGDHDQFGRYSVSDEDDPICTWMVKGSEEKSFIMSELCNSSELERERYEFGMLLSAFCDNFGHVIRRIYGDSVEVINYQAKCFKAAEDFKHWAKVPASHMIFPKAS